MQHRFLSVFVACGLVIAFCSLSVEAQDDPPPYECDDNFGECGTPQQSGGGGGGGGGGSILIDNTDLGDTYQYADDYDDDGIEDPYDNCPFTPNRDQADDDGDNVGSGCDNCPNTPNENQDNLDGDTIGDACDDDIDGDGVPNGEDNCPRNPNPPIDGVQKDADSDGMGNACDDDMDNDGIDNLEDNCPLVANPDQADDDPGKYGDACDEDDDGDSIRNTHDNCPLVANEFQDDNDNDGLGDACDPDRDNDGLTNLMDNCPDVANPDQLDLDRDGLGEECDDLYCYVVMWNSDDCLDPTDAFRVYSPDVNANTGDDIRLRLFANRINQPLRYVWQVVESPSGSNATIKHPQGAASISTPYEYHYLKDRIVNFRPDMPGTYTLHVVGTLVWPDEVTGVAHANAETELTVTVEGEPIDSASCSTVPVGKASLISWGTLVLLTLISLGIVLLRR